MNELALFAGAGGGILGGQLLGWETVCAVEVNAFCARRLMQRQNEGHLPCFPIWDDVCTFDGRPWRGIVDVVSGGFPCQDISVAGKGAGIDGERSGLWGEMARIIDEVRPTFVYVENSPILTSRGLGVVLGDLAEMGYDAEWGVLGAADVGANHERERIWIVAHDNSQRRRVQQIARREAETDINYNGTKKPVADADGKLSPKPWVSRTRRPESSNGSLSEQRWQDSDPWATDPDVGRVATGVAFRVDRLKAIGNGQVPACMAEAWRRLMARVTND